MMVDTPARKLLYYNAFNFLVNILALEEHAIEMTSEEISHSHCMNKHSMQAYGHHLREFLNHCERDPECKEKVLEKMKRFTEEFKKDVVDPLTKEGKPVDLNTLTSKRNEFRALVSVLFPDLAKVGKGCAICELDQAGQMKWLEKGGKARA